MAKREVKINIITEVDASNYEDLKEDIERNNAKEMEVTVDVDESELDSAKSKEEDLDDSAKVDVDVDVDDSEVIKSDEEIDKLNRNVEIDVSMNGISAIKEGFNDLKQSASEIGERLATSLESAGKQETNFAFLKQAIGDADIAKKKMEDINTVVQKLPGDDSILQGLLSQGVAKEASLTTQELEKMGGAAADYFAAMQNFGKSSSEAFQDMNNYLLTGLTAEIERSPILANHIDELKAGKTIQERSLLLQKALNEEHWGGISQQDTYNNKLETFNGMLERGQYNLGGLFQSGAKGAMDFALRLDEASGGLLGMGIAASGFVTPITEGVISLGQMATGIKALKELKLVKMLKESAAAQWLLNIAQSMSPVHIIIIAIIALIAALTYLYFNNEQVRNAINGLGQAFMWAGQVIYNSIINAVNWVIGALQNLWNYIITLGGLLPANVNITGNRIVDTILRVMMFIATLPAQLAMIFINMIAKTLGFGNNFVQNIMRAGVNSVNGFLNYIRQLPGKLAGELQAMINNAIEFAKNLPQILAQAALNAINIWEWITGEHSPGKMYYMFTGELDAMQGAGSSFSRVLPSIMGESASNLVSSFNPKLNNNTTGDSGAPNGGTVININVGSVDDESTIQKIAEAVQRVLAFDNETAGRTV